MRQDGAWQTASIAELERPDGWAPIRRHFDIRAFGVNAWTARAAGGVVIPEHDEVPSVHEELYIVVSGHATFTVDGDEIDAPTGTIVFVSDPASSRGAVAKEPGTTVVTAGARPGEAYRPRAWETNQDVIALLDSGDHEGAKRLLVAALDQYEDRGGLLYNLACAEAQLGETDAAVEHIQAAILERPDFAAPAREDDDLAPIRDDPRFVQAVGS